MQFAKGSAGAVAALLLAACTEPTPPPLTPHSEQQSAVEDPHAADDPGTTGGETQGDAGAARRDDAAEENQSNPGTDGDHSCQGEATKALMENLRKRGATSRGCFTALLRRGTEARGQVKVALAIDATGKVKKIDFEGDDVADIEFSQCLRNHFQVAFSTTPPEGGCLHVKVPLNFSVKKEPSP